MVQGSCCHTSRRALARRCRRPIDRPPLSDRQWGSFFVSFIYELHQELLLGKPGEVFVGILAVFLLVSIRTGLYLWWPALGKLRRALSFQSGGSPIRRHYDVHKLTGLAGTLLLTLLAVTGFYLEFPDAVTSVVRWFSPVRDTSPRTATSIRTASRIAQASARSGHRNSSNRLP
ncbi:MAG: PepSY domain-containing protein [Nitrospira sp.]|nr:PepSY domain-containing protein [Nitrospira sp.]